MSGGAGRVLRAAEGELGERSFGRVAAGGEDPAGDVVDGVEDDRADSVGRGAHRGEREARSVARAVDVPLVVAQRGADRVEIANVGLGVVVVEVDPSGLQPGAAARVRLDDRRSFDLERIGALQVPQPHLVPFGAVEGGECLACAALVVEHHPDVPAGVEVGKNLVPTRVVQAPPMGQHDGRRPASDRTIGQDLLGHDVGAVGDGDTVDPQ